MSTYPNPETIMNVLGDDCARRILCETSKEPQSATELADRSNVSQQTIYRRLDQLLEAGLVSETTRPRADGHHDTVYEALLNRFELHLRDGSFEADLERSDETGRPADELTRLWRNF